MNRRTRLLALLALPLLAACNKDNGDLPPDAGVVRAVHAIPELDTLTMTFDDNELGDFTYAQIRGINRPGDGMHRLLFDVKLPGSGSPTQRLRSVNLAGAVDLEQTLVLTGTLDDPHVLTWEQPARDWAAEQAASSSDITVLDVAFGHAALSRGALDFYLGPADFDPATTAPMASLAYGELQGNAELDSGTYQLVVTPAGDPTTELMRSISLVVPAVTSIMFVAFDGARLDDNGDPRVVVRSLGNGLSGVLVDQLQPPMIRGLNAATDIGDVDVVFGDDNELLLSGLSYGVRSDYVEAPLTATTMYATPVGTPATHLAPLAFATTQGVLTTLLVTGVTDSVALASITDDTRRIVTEAKLRVVQGSSAFSTSMDVYLVDRDAGIGDATPRAVGLTYRSATVPLPVAAGEYDLVLTPNGSKNIASGPTHVSLSDGGLYTAVATNAAQDDKVQLLLLDDFAN